MDIPPNPVPEPFSRLEVVPAERGALIRPEIVPGRKEHSNLEFVGAQPETNYSDEAGIGAVYPSFKDEKERFSSTRTQRRKWIVWVVLACIVVVGAVLGGTLGTVLSKNHSPQTTTG